MTINSVKTIFKLFSEFESRKWRFDKGMSGYISEYISEIRIVQGKIELWGSFSEQHPVWLISLLRPAYIEAFYDTYRYREFVWGKYINYALGKMDDAKKY